MSAIDCPTCQGRGYVIVNYAPVHDHWDIRCRERRPDDALLAGAECVVCAADHDLGDNEIDPKTMVVTRMHWEYGNQFGGWA